MLDASHALIGASIAKTIPNPYLSIPLALATHFLADVFPHWDFRTRKTNRSKLDTIVISLSDAGVGFILGFILFGSQVDILYLFTLMFIAQLPDWLEAPYHIFNWRFFPFTHIKKLQSKWHNKLGLPWGLIYQVAIVTLIVTLAKLY